VALPVAEEELFPLDPLFMDELLLLLELELLTLDELFVSLPVVPDDDPLFMELFEPAAPKLAPLLSVPVPEICA
jgi:hypothetical protein